MKLITYAFIIYIIGLSTPCVYGSEIVSEERLDSDLQESSNRQNQRTKKPSCTMGYHFVKQIIKKNLNINLTGTFAYQAVGSLLSNKFRLLNQKEVAPVNSVCVFGRESNKYGQTYIMRSNGWVAQCTSPDKSLRPTLKGKKPLACYAPPKT